MSSLIAMKICCQELQKIGYAPNATSTGRPPGTERFIKKLEKALDRLLLPKKAGRSREKKRV